MSWEHGEIQVRQRCPLAGKHWPSEECPCKQQDGWLYEWVSVSELAAAEARALRAQIAPAVAKRIEGGE